MDTNPWITDDKTTPESSDSDDTGQDKKDKEDKGSSPGDSYANQFTGTKEEQETVSKDQDIEREREEERESTDTPGRSRESEPERPALSTPEGELRNRLEEKRKATPEEELPYLSKDAHERLDQNQREFARIEGNLREMDRSMQVIYYTSCFEKEGKSTVVTSTAYGLAEFNDCDVLLVDTNNDAPLLHKMFGVTLSPGLQEILQTTATPEQAIIPTAYQRLYLLPAGESEGSILSEGLENTLELFRTNFDYVLLDGKAILSSSEVTNLAPFMDGFVLVVQCEKTKWEVVNMAKHKLDNAGAAQTGIFLNQRKYYLPNFIYQLISK